jgi:hypothetical protein
MFARRYGEKGYGEGQGSACDARSGSLDGDVELE